VSKCANPLDLLFLLLPPLEQVERLPGGLRWARGWSLIVVVVQQVVIGCSIIVVGGIVIRGVVVEEIVGRAGHSFSPAQVRQEAPFIFAPKLVIRIRNNGEEHHYRALSSPPHETPPLSSRILAGTLAGTLEF